MRRETIGVDFKFQIKREAFTAYAGPAYLGTRKAFVRVPEPTCCIVKGVKPDITYCKPQTIDAQSDARPRMCSSLPLAWIGS